MKRNTIIVAALTLLANSIFKDLLGSKAPRV
jgi:hypothetical protein